jgi:hypothetical protein
MIVRTHLRSALLLGACCLLAGCPRPRPDLPDETVLSNPEHRALRIVQQLCTISREQGETIWPGYQFHIVPLLIHRPHQRSFLINPATPPAGWEKISQRGFSETAYMTSSKSLDISSSLPFSRAYKVAGQEVFLVRHLNGSRDDAWFRLVVHEVFHEHQHHSWDVPAFPAACRYPYLSEENAFLARIEEKLLTLVVGGLQLSGLEQRAVELVSIRLARYSLEPSGPVVMAIEEWEELVEGTARYVEEMYAIAAGLTTRQEVTEGLVKYFRNFKPTQLQKWKYYRTGIALALLLDVLGDVDWKASIADAGGQFPLLQQRFAEAVVTAPGTLPADLMKQFSADREVTATALKKYREQEETALEKWHSEGTYRIELVLPISGSAYYTNRGMTFHLEDCSRLATGVIAFVDQRYALELKKRGIAFRNLEPGYQVSFHHDLKNGSLLLDGEEVAPTTTGKRSFSTGIEINFPQFQLLHSGRGWLESTAQRMTITIEEDQSSSSSSGPY